MKKLIQIAILIISFTAVDVNADIDMYGVSHGIIAGAIVGGTSLVTRDPKLLYTAAGLTCAGFIARELRGPGNLFGYPEGYDGPFNDADRILDWVVPCAVGFGTAYLRKEAPVIAPTVGKDSIGINIFKRW